DDPTRATCASCHEPHSMGTGTAVAPAVPPNLGAIDGVNTAGAAAPTASFGYEACFKCHGDQAVTTPLVARQVEQNNTRLEFASSAVTFHPVAGPGRNTDGPSLRSGYTTASIIACTDCHSSDTGAMGGGAAGPHGSNNTPLLVANYDTMD